MRTASAILLLFFSLQLSRFYIAATPQQDTDAAYCPVPGGESATLDADHHGAELTRALPAEQDSGFYFTHCKDTFDGFSLAPALTLALAAVTAQYVPETASAKPSPFESRFSGFSAPPILQPPRFTS